MTTTTAERLALAAERDAQKAYPRLCGYVPADVWRDIVLGRAALILRNQDASARTDAVAVFDAVMALSIVEARR